MKLTLEYLKQRHEYWKYRLDLRDIWDHYKFKSVEIVLRKQSKFYDGMFCRTFIRSNTRLKMTSGINGCYYDRICIYQNKPEYTTREIDDTLVHEMIHQYIFQNDLPDTSTHGRLFKDFMQRINEAFPQELKISIYDEAPILKGPGTKTHKLILLWMKDGECYCCKINPSKVPLFVKLIEKNQIAWKLKGYLLCESNDMYFDDIPACRKYLHGLPISLPELRELFNECNIKRI